MSIFSKIFSEPKEEELVLVFDIGSASVGGALFISRKSEGPKILLSLREPIILEDEITPERFLVLTMQSLQILASRICVAGLGAPKKIFCVLSSPWYTSQTRTIKLEKNTPFTFTHKLADDLIKKEVSLFQGEHLFKYAKDAHKVRHFELKSMKTLLNGYHAPHPLGKTAKELEIAIFVSLSGEHVLGQIEEVIFRHFHRRSVKYSSFVMAAFTVARDLFSEEDFILIDIGGEMTDISMVKKNVLRESSSFPLGHNFMIRRAASMLGGTLGEAKSYISLYKDKHIGGVAEKKLEHLMGKLKTEWLKSFQESLANLSDDISIPKNIFITVTPDLAPFFTEIIKSEEFNQYSLTEAKFQVRVLNVDALHGVADFRENAARDPFLIIESVYINRFLC